MMTGDEKLGRLVTYLARVHDILPSRIGADAAGDDHWPEVVYALPRLDEVRVMTTSNGGLRVVCMGYSDQTYERWIYAARNVFRWHEVLL
jgi:hypothetical protein